MKVRATAGVLFVAMAVGRAAEAQETSTEIVWRQLVNRAMTARAAGDHVIVLDLAGRAGAIRMTPALRLMLAQEHNVLGHALDALNHALRCVAEARAQPTIANHDGILATCEALVTSLHSRVATVTVHAPDPTPAGLRVRVQGSEIDRALWGLPYPVLPGTIRVDATGPGDAIFRREVVVEGGANAEVTVSFAPGVMQVSTPHPPNGEGPRVTTQTPAPTPNVAATHGPGVGPWIVAGAGVAVLGVAAGLYVLRGQAIDNQNSSCNSTVCFPGAVAYHDDALTYNTAGAVALGVGIAAVAGGVAWLVLGRPRAETRPRTAWNVSVTPSQGGWMLGVGGGL